jgi:predicted nucleotide-binding protein
VQKEKEYENTRFSADVIREAFDVARELASRLGAELNGSLLSVEHDDSSWDYDSIDEFFADFRKYGGYAHFQVWSTKLELKINSRPRNATISVKASTRADIERVFEVFEKNAIAAALPPEPTPATPEVVVFIGHGRSPAWRDLKDHLQDKHGFRVEAYETGARAGHSIRNILEDMTRKSSFAILVMTGEDEQADGSLRARQNVIHEAGLFQGRLGFSRSILLLEEGVEHFSNVEGIQYIPFARGNIKETFGELLATLRREFS